MWGAQWDIWAPAVGMYEWACSSIVSRIVEGSPDPYIASNEMRTLNGGYWYDPPPGARPWLINNKIWSWQKKLEVPEVCKRMGNTGIGRGIDTISSRFQLKDAVSQVAQMITAIIRLTTAGCLLPRLLFFSRFRHDFPLKIKTTFYCAFFALFMAGFASHTYIYTHTTYHNLTNTYLSRLITDWG